MQELQILNFPILNDWKLISFDKELSADDIKKYSQKCNGVSSGLSNSNKIQSVLCGKVLRNFDELLKNEESNINNCLNFNVWLYVIIKYYQYSIDEIQTYFNLTDSPSNKLYILHKCSLDWFNEITEMDNIIKLYNFNEYVKNIKNRIGNIIQEEYNALCKYVHDCILLYKRLSSTYCKNRDNGSSTLCDEIKKFTSYYRTYIQGLDEDKSKNFPLLENYTVSNEFYCLSEAEKYEKRFSLLKNHDIVKSQVHNIDARKVHHHTTQEYSKERAVNINQKYGFFDDLNIYQANEKQYRSDENMDTIDYYCNKLYINEEKWKSNTIQYCKDFIMYYFFLSRNMGKNMPNVSEYIKYLNYWIENKLRSSGDEEFKTFFYSSLSEIYEKFQLKDELSDKIKKIDDIDFKKMTILYKLYDNYNKIESEKIDPYTYIKTKCNEYANNCNINYLEGINMYQKSKDYDFYLALKEFDTLYRNVQYRSVSCRHVIQTTLPEIKKIEEKYSEKIVQKSLKTCEQKESDTTEDDTIENNKYETILKDLPFYVYYSTLNKNNYLEGYNDKYCGKVERLSHTYPWICKLCKMISKNLHDISKSDDEEERKKKCLYFNYWIYDQIRKKFNHKNYDLDVVLTLLDVVVSNNRDLQNNYCNMIYDSSISMEEWKEMKELHDYFKGYENIKSYVTSDVIKQKHYCEYITYINEIYKRHLKDSCVCISNPSFFCFEKFPDYFKCDKTYYPNNLLTKFKCDAEKTEESVESLFKSVTTDHDIATYYSRLSKTCTRLTCDPFYASTLVAFLILGLFFTHFFFYKITPLGSWFDKKILKKKKHMQNIHTRSIQHLQEKDSKNKYENIRKKQIHLVYQSL
ncbi:variable surface protein [Plasmodium gonderi]|uniref:Variable surface protein n=1 Tax=Plasmodium gonderi TaxID=77519 RepID=A0A1Y1JJW3_PLAGO|nr:variable surface protein [Plasmodium gonderi]GAW82741.1 variable surface protein [Plasmodium gonderi]